MKEMALLTLLAALMILQAELLTYSARVHSPTFTPVHSVERSISSSRPGAEDVDLARVPRALPALSPHRATVKQVSSR